MRRLGRRCSGRRRGDFDAVEVDELCVAVLVFDLVVAKIFVLVEGLDGHAGVVEFEFDGKTVVLREAHDVVAFA